MPIHIARTWCKMHLKVRLIVQVRANQPVPIGTQPIGLWREPKRLENLGVACVVPIAKSAIGKPSQELAHVLKIGNLADGAIFQTQAHAA